MKAKIQEAMKAAMKAGDKVRTGVLRMILADIQAAELAGREVMDGLMAFAKRAEKSIEEYTRLGKHDEVAKLKQEQAIVGEQLAHPDHRDGGDVAGERFLDRCEPGVIEARRQVGEAARLQQLRAGDDREAGAGLVDRRELAQHADLAGRPGVGAHAHEVEVRLEPLDGPCEALEVLQLGLLELPYEVTRLVHRHVHDRAGDDQLALPGGFLGTGEHAPGTVDGCLAGGRGRHGGERGCG